MSKDSIKLVITGRIAPSKGQAHAAEAVGKLVRAGVDIELCIVGDKFLPDDDMTLKKAIEKYGIADRVHLVGHQGNPLPYVALSDIGIMASRMEAFGRTTFEYLALGKPVVGANGGATPEIVHDGKNGYLFELSKKSDMVKKIQKYVDDRTLIAKHSKAAKKTAVEMMGGIHNDESLYAKVSEAVGQANVEPLPNIARVWIGYPRLAQQYIEESRVTSLKRIVYIKLRQRAKVIVVAIQKKLKKNKAL